MRECDGGEPVQDMQALPKGAHRVLGSVNVAVYQAGDEELGRWVEAGEWEGGGEVVLGEDGADRGGGYGGDEVRNDAIGDDQECRWEDFEVKWRRR